MFCRFLVYAKKKVLIHERLSYSKFQIVIFKMPLDKIVVFEIMHVLICPLMEFHGPKHPCKFYV